MNLKYKFVGLAHVFICCFLGKKQTTPLDAALGPEFPECYPTSYRCDGQVDCPNDEINDESSCPDESVSLFLILEEQLAIVFNEPLKPWSSFS